MERILFCNIAYMQYYDFYIFKETPKHGGKYVMDTGDAYEKNNFHICEDGIVRGFVETKYVDGSATAQKPRQLRIENIDSAYKKEESIDGVTVVFCAHSDIHKKTVIVGWYNNATVYRARHKYNGRQFNISCTAENACLLTEDVRTFVVPRASQSGYGFGQSNVWFAKDETVTGYINRVLEYTDSHHEASISLEETLSQAIPEKYQESGIGKKVMVNKYERNPIARRKCLAVHGTNCMVCGFNAAKVYGNDFAGKIEIHHIIPISEIDEDYKVDPTQDLVPVCPNCHTMLHTKMHNGEYPTVNELKELCRRNEN